jgi:LiaF transmembrane domain
MRIRRGLLFWGLFLILLGAIPLLARAGVIPEDTFADIWRWWPLLLIGLGIALLLGRSQAGLIGTAIVAIVLGVLGGSALASNNTWIGNITDCAGAGGQTTPFDGNGSLRDGASATIELDCGSLDLSAVPGAAWQVHADYRGAEPRADDGAGNLSVRTPPNSGAHRQDWTISLGTDALRDLDLKINAASSSVVLAGSDLSSLEADMNAGDMLLDGSGATISRIDASVNAGRLRVTLEGPSSGDLSMNAGAIELCVPADAQLQLEVKDQLTFATNLASRGMVKDGDTWTKSGTGGLIDLSVEGNAASFTLDPEGGCK